MPGIETVKIIVDAEKEGANIIKEAQAKALEIKKSLDAMIETARESSLSDAKRKASSIVETAESEGKMEASKFEKQSIQSISELVKEATAKKELAVKALYDIIVGD
jgi:vacuolar-type H+-ATPase subunit H